MNPNLEPLNQSQKKMQIAIPTKTADATRRWTAHHAISWQMRNKTVAATPDRQVNDEEPSGLSPSRKDKKFE
jgi:hypothetical protein